MLMIECPSPLSNRSAYHFAVGLQCRLRTTNHPQAIGYQGSECKIIAVRIMQSNEPMLIVEFPDGTQVRGLFFYELEDLEGNQLFREVFNRLCQARRMSSKKFIYQII